MAVSALGARKLFRRLFGMPQTPSAARANNSDRIVVLAKIRGESERQLRERFSDQVLSRLPAMPKTKHIAGMRQSGIVETGLKDGMSYARLDNGRVFYSHPPRKSQRTLYDLIGDTLPKPITEDGYSAALDVAQRYRKEFKWRPDLLVDKPDNNVIELGAYLGHKTFHLAEEVAGRGQVLAVEMMPENVEVLRRNVLENGMEDKITVLPVGVSKESGVRRVYSKGKQRNSIVPDALTGKNEILDLPVQSMDDIVGSWDVGMVDLVYASVNGAEAEAIEGLNAQRDRVERIVLEARYFINSVSVRDSCEELLLERGYAIADPSIHFKLIGIPPVAGVPGQPGDA